MYNDYGPEHRFFTPYCSKCDTTFFYLEESWPGGRSSEPMPCSTCGEILGNAEEDAELFAQAKGNIGDDVRNFMSEEKRQELERIIGTPEERQAEIEALHARYLAKTAEREKTKNSSPLLPPLNSESSAKKTCKIKEERVGMRVSELIAALQQEDPEAIVYVEVPERYLKPVFYEAFFKVEEVNKGGTPNRVNLFPFEPNIDHDDLSSWPESFRNEYVLKEDHHEE